MKFLFYTTYFTSHTGGVEKFLCELITWLCDRGHEAAVICEDPSGSPLFDYPDHCPIFRCKLRSREKEDLREFRDIVESYAPDVFIFTSHHHGLSRKAWTWLAGLNLHYVISEHNPPRKIYEFIPRILREANAATADGIHVLLPSFGTDISFVGSEKLVDIQHVVTPPKLVAKPDQPVDGRYRIINIGRLDLNQKCQDFLIEAFARVAGDFPEWDLVMAGSMWNQEEKDKVGSLISTYGLMDRVRLLGPIKNVEEELSRSHIFGFPSAFEALPLALQEALAVGLPAVGMQECEGTNFLIRPEQNGTLVPSEKGIEGYADALRVLMADHELRAKLGQNARTVAIGMTPKKIFGQWEAFLTSVTKRPAALFNLPSKSEALRALASSDSAILSVLASRDHLASLRFNR